MMEQLGLTVLFVLTLVAIIAVVMVAGWFMARYQRYWPVAAVLVIWIVSWYWAGRIIRENRINRLIQEHQTNRVDRNQ